MASVPESVVSPLLEMRGISKTYPGVRALQEVDLSLEEGEVLALLGENGAGKSTLIKVLGGAHLPTSGDVLLRGTSINLNSPTISQDAGIAIIYQEFNLVPDMTVQENLFLGREIIGKYNLIDEQAERTKAQALFKRIGIAIDPETRCRDLTVAQQQMFEIAKALLVDAKILVLDEPTAALTEQEVSRLLEIIAELRRDGIGMIYISHRLDEIYQIADRIIVLRDGATVGGGKTEDIDRNRLIELMVGRSLEKEFPSRSATLGDERLRVENLNRGQAVQEVSFSVRSGEVLGLAGLVGAGRTETARLIFGADPLESGRVLLGGEETQIDSPRDAIRQRICLLTEDRKGQGLVLSHTVRENFGLPNLKEFENRVFIDGEAEANAFADYVKSLQIKISNHEQLAGNLSGGNQQKSSSQSGCSETLIF
ncbi:MAG: sugar ABC transporter ATP-binding protein [Verrucomicrobiota bacterium]